MIKQLLNSVVAQYRDLSVSCRSIISSPLTNYDILLDLVQLLPPPSDVLFAPLLVTEVVLYFTEQSEKNKETSTFQIMESTIMLAI